MHAAAAPAKPSTYEDDLKHVRSKVGALASPLTATPSVIRGLHNLGNTCFINASLQLLLNCAPFFALTSTVSIPSTLHTTLPLLHALNKLTQQLYSDQSASRASSPPFNPSEIVGELTRLHPTLRSAQARQQHDAEEMITFILSSLHEELVTGVMCCVLQERWAH